MIFPESAQKRVQYWKKNELVFCYTFRKIGGGGVRPGGKKCYTCFFLIKASLIPERIYISLRFVSVFSVFVEKTCCIFEIFSRKGVIIRSFRIKLGASPTKSFAVLENERLGENSFR